MKARPQPKSADAHLAEALVHAMRCYQAQNAAFRADLRNRSDRIHSERLKRAMQAIENCICVLRSEVGIDR